MNGQHWQLRVTTTPGDTSYVLVVDGREVQPVTEWPACWSRSVDLQTELERHESELAAERVAAAKRAPRIT